MTSIMLSSSHAFDGPGDSVDLDSTVRTRTRSRRMQDCRLDAIRYIGRAKGAYHSMGLGEKLEVVEERLVHHAGGVVTLRMEEMVGERIVVLGTRATHAIRSGAYEV